MVESQRDPHRLRCGSSQIPYSITGWNSDIFPNSRLLLTGTHKMHNRIHRHSRKFRACKLILFLCAGLISGNAWAENADRLLRKAGRYFSPLPAQMPGAENDTPQLISLGSKLYADPRLSKNDTQSCASCHPLDNMRAGMDNLPRSPGAEGALGSRNTPTVLNAGWQFALFWDGRAKDLADQAGQPILNPIEMGMPDQQSVIDKLAGLEEYRSAFREAYPDSEDPITYAHLTRAIAAFERTLRSDSRFDDFLRGDPEALNAQEQNGLNLFIRTNCVRCHDGPMVGGTLYEKLGVYTPFHNIEDQGRFEVTKKEADRMVFKVASLRNVALTSPWFHDGSAASLADVVRLMGRMQLEVELKDGEIADIVAFLGSLSDKALEKKP